MRGGTSKGVFFRERDLPADPARARPRAAARHRQPRPLRQADRRHGGGHLEHEQDRDPRAGRRVRTATWTTSSGRSPSTGRSIDWSGNCGNLTGAVGPFAVSEGLVEAPRDGTAVVRIWQANVGERIVAHVPVRGGEVVEEGDFELDGVTFPSAEIRLEFMDPGGEDGDGEAGGTMFPTRRVVDPLEVPGVGRVDATLINAGNPTVFVEARRAGAHGHGTAGGRERRCRAPRALRGGARARRRSPWASRSRRRKPPAAARPRPSSRSSRRRSRTAPPAARPSTRATSRSPRASSRWASCTTR